MKVFMMTDLEGVAGVQDSENWGAPGNLYYAKARELLTAEVNAAADGLISGGARDILVADGHGHGAIEHELLDRRVRLVRNWSRMGTFAMDEEKFDFAAWVGQHPKAGTVGGHLCHTGNFSIVEESINGIVVGEFGGLVLVASSLGVRSIFASGCEAFCREAEDFVPGIETVSVKRGMQPEPGDHLPAMRYERHNVSAVHLHPEEARERIRKGAETAITRALSDDFGLVKVPAAPYTRTRILRADSENPPRVFRQSHPGSIIEMLRAPFTLHELKINPAVPELRALTGKQILL